MTTKPRAGRSSPPRPGANVSIPFGPWALSYRRVSTTRQVREDPAGLERQEKIFLDFCQEHSLDPLGGAFVDPGRSAYRSSHLHKGAMGRLMAQARAGLIPDRTVLVIEWMNRFTRDCHSNAIPQLIELLKEGLVIAIPNNRLIFDRSTYDSDLSIRLLVDQAIDSGRAYSDMQSYMAQHKWDERQRQWFEDGKRYGGKSAIPFWLNWDPDRQDFTPNDKVALLQEIFRLSAEGMGNSQIAIDLNARGWRTPAKDLPFAPGLIHRLMTDRRVLGEKTFSDGTVAPGYFPVVITAQEWQASADAMAKRRKLNRRVGRGTAINNLFQGGIFCTCGQSLYAQQYKTGEAAYFKLRCCGKRNNTCTTGSTPILYDEQHLLKMFMAVDKRWAGFFEQSPKASGHRAAMAKQREAEAELAACRGRVARAEGNFSRLMQSTDLSAATIEQAGAVLEAERQQLTTAQEAVAAAQRHVAQVKSGPTAREMRKLIRAKVEAFMDSGTTDLAERRRFNNWFLNLGLRIVLFDDGRRLQMAVEPLEKATHSGDGSVSVAGAEIHVSATR